jgi:hypothetical protein
MNQKISKYAKAEGFCCMWAFLEANRAVFTSRLYAKLVHVCTLRALQQQRAKYRSGQIKCEKLDCCLKDRAR